MRRVLRIALCSAAILGLVAIGVLLPTFKAAAENLAAFDGSIYAALRVASLANFPATAGNTTSVSAGAELIEKGPRLSALNAPAAGTAASASVAANATARHVIDCIDFSSVSSGAVTAANVTLVIRDGASGAGTILWQKNFAIATAAAASVQEINQQGFCGLNLVGSTNTAMTVEFSAGVANAPQTVNFSYYNVQ